MKIRKTIPVSFSDNVLNFSLPDSWEKLTQEQLRYVCLAMSLFDAVKAKTYIFIRLSGIKVLKVKPEGWLCSVLVNRKKIRFFLQNWQVQSFIRTLDFIDMPGNTPVCLRRIGKLEAVNVLFHDVIFRDYIKIENHYQGYLHTSDIRQLQEMARMMYVDQHGRHPDKLRMSDVESLSVFLWYAALKNCFAVYFPYFFGRPGEGGNEQPGMIEIMNAQIRALTGGDITKESEVLNMDCWRALTELNEKARETIEWKEKYGRN